MLDTERILNFLNLKELFWWYKKYNIQFTLHCRGLLLQWNYFGRSVPIEFLKMWFIRRKRKQEFLFLRVSKLVWNQNYLQSYNSYHLTNLIHYIGRLYFLLQTIKYWLYLPTVSPSFKEMIKLHIIPIPNQYLDTFVFMSLMKLAPYAENSSYRL